jgi:hypothetical protein
MDLDQLINEIKKNKKCKVLLPSVIPTLPAGLKLPKDLERFYELTGGVSLHTGSNYPIGISEPDKLERANPIIVGEDWI